MITEKQETRKIGSLERLAISAQNSRSVQLIGEFLERQWNRFTEEGTIPGVGTVHYIKSSLQFGDKHLPGHEIASYELALARMYGTPVYMSLSSRPHLSAFSRLDSYVDEGVVCIPRERKILLVRPGALSLYDRAMGENHKRGREFHLDEGNERWYSDMASRRDPLVTAVTSDSVPTNRFGEDETMQWLFGKAAEEYGKYLQWVDVKNFSIDLNDQFAGQNVPAYMRRLIMSGLMDDAKVGIFDSAETHLAKYGVRKIVRTPAAQAEYERMIGFGGGK